MCNSIQFNSSKCYWKMCMDLFYKSSITEFITEIMGPLAYVQFRCDSFFQSILLNSSYIRNVYSKLRSFILIIHLTNKLKFFSFAKIAMIHQYQNESERHFLWNRTFESNSFTLKHILKTKYTLNNISGSIITMDLNQQYVLVSMNYIKNADKLNCDLFLGK